MDNTSLITEPMKHSYYYVVAGAMCDSTTLLYKVSIGMSLQGRRDYDFLKSYALQHNHYFCAVSAESDIFMRNLLDSLAEFDLKLQHVEARSLVRIFKSCCADPLNPSTLSGANYQLKQLDTSYRIISNLNRRAACSAKRSTSKT